MRILICIVAIILTLGACGKKEAISITKDNLLETLTKYGKENPETMVEIKTSYGMIKLRLFEETPLHRANFVKNIKEGYYKNPEFYRVVYEFMIQGGDINKSLPYRVPSEFRPNLYHKKGTLAMARTDNPEMESSSTEFYIIQGRRYAEYEVDEEARNAGITLTPEQREAYMTVGGDMSLDQKYTVFGEVVEGLEIVDTIAKSKVYNERPNEKIPFEIKVLGN